MKSAAMRYWGSGLISQKMSIKSSHLSIYKSNQNQKTVVQTSASPYSVAVFLFLTWKDCVIQKHEILFHIYSKNNWSRNKKQETGWETSGVNRNLKEFANDQETGAECRTLCTTGLQLIEIRNSFEIVVLKVFFVWILKVLWDKDWTF